MNLTKALTSLRLVTGRGMDNGEEGAVLLANQVVSNMFMYQQNEANTKKANAMEPMSNIF